MPDELKPFTRRQLRTLDDRRLQVADAAEERRLVERELIEQRRVVAATTKERDRLLGREVAAAELRRIETAVAGARSRERELVADLATANGTLGRVREHLDDILATARDPWTALDAEIPVAMLPIRIETRFVSGSLRVRVYPDVVHIEQLEEALTDDELAAGHQYWLDQWAHSASTDVFEEFAVGRNRTRAAWVAAATTPTNLDRLGFGEPDFPDVALRPAGPSRPALAELLPGRWTIVGYRGDVQVLRVTSTPVRHPLSAGLTPVESQLDDPPPDDRQASLEIDDELRWLVDYDEAVAAGMAITITTDDDRDLMSGYDRLVVTGVDHRRTPDAAAAELERVLAAHAFTDGAGFVIPGTPTNAAADDRVPSRPVAPVPHPAVSEADADSSGVRASRALGLRPDSVSTRLSGASTDHDPLTGDVATVLWQPTLGRFLAQMMNPIVDSDDIARVREHFRLHVRPGGPLPTMRIGDQPLGLLPVTSTRSFTGDRTDTVVASTLQAIERFWSYAARDAFALGDSGDPAADLVTLLEHHDRARSFRVREAVGPLVAANAEGREFAATYQQATALLMLAAMGVSGRPTIVDVTLGDGDWVAPIPLVTGTPSADPLEVDYVARVLGRLRTRGGYAKLRTDPASANTLFEALLIAAADAEMVRVSLRLVLDEFQVPITLERADTTAEFVADPIDLRIDDTQLDRILRAGDLVVDTTTETPRLNMTAAAIATSRVRAVSGDFTVVDAVVQRPDVELLRTPRSRQFAEFRAAVGRLVGAPTDELDRAVAGTLDAVSHRYDAWATSLAARRLDANRRRHPRGIQLGAFGWVEGLRPADAGRESGGFVHAPSISHATTAAILRSGHIARTAAAGEALDIDLSSARVRRALTVLEGMRAGQSMSALLGYRWERALRDRGPQFRAVRAADPSPPPAPERSRRRRRGPTLGGDRRPQRRRRGGTRRTRR